MTDKLFKQYLTCSQRIQQWNEQRGLLDNPFSTDLATLNLLEKIITMRVQIPSIEAREIAKMYLDDIYFELKSYEPTTPEQKINALCNIQIYATGDQLKLKYDSDITMDETLKEIESRKGSIQNGKFIKFEDKDSIKQRYKANYKKAYKG